MATPTPKSLPSSSVTADAEKEKQDWARMMRKKFTPADMIDVNGNLLQEYFQPKVRTTVTKPQEENEDKPE
jgi:hypothetical protein